MLDPQEEGRKWEEIWKRTVQGQNVIGSGNQFEKLDVRGRKIQWSNKWSGKETFTLTQALIQEFVDAVEAPGGTGSARMGALAIRLPHNDVVVMRASDFLELMKEPPIIQAEKADNRRATARVPQLLRDAGSSGLC